MNQKNVGALEHRYQALFSDFQAGKIDEATFISEVDKLQFRDDWGRYWMLGAQTGAWHYFDGQSWHQADPAEADKLPFMDDQDRYWQKGTKSGDWYYYESATNEWVKPGQDDDLSPSFAKGEQWQGVSAEAAAQSPYTYAQPQSAQSNADDYAQFNNELFQDDEGRYWAVGAKTGQWYFYDDTGWHPAHEFQSTLAAQRQHPQPYQPQPSTYAAQPQQPQTPYQPPQSSWPTQVYASQPSHLQEPQVTQTQAFQPQVQQPIPQQPVSPFQHQPGQEQPGPAVQGAPPAETHATHTYQTPPQQPIEQPSAPVSPQPSQEYTTSPAQDTQTIKEQPSQIYSAQPQPSPSVPDAQTEAPAQPTSSEQDASEMPKPPQSTSQSGTWYYFDGKQWLKYSSGEPADISPPDPRMILEQEPGPVKVKVEPKSEPVVAELFEEDEPPVEVVDVEVITVIEAEPDPGTESNYRSTPEPPKESIAATPTVSDEVRPRRSKSSANIPAARSTPVESQPQPKKRTPADTGRPVTPRKRAAAHEPTIIIPTGSATSNISSPSSARKSGASRPTQADRRRARENTLPLEPMPVADAQATSPTGRSRHRQVTQAMPPVARTAGARPDTGQMRVAQRARQPTKEKIALAATQQPAETEPEKTGYTFGDILRAFPSTLWTIAAGLVVLLLFAIVIIGAWWAWSQFQGDSSGVSSVAPLQGPTPTLAAGPPDSTPTPGPTPSTVPEPVATSTPSSMITFSSADLDFTLEYPEGWQNKEETLQAIFSPSVEGLDPDELKDTSMRIGVPADNSSDISDLLTGVLAKFPADVETLNEGTISIASQTWTSTQIRFENEDLGGQGIATLAVTNKDGMGYFLVAAAPAEQWNSVQPLFQAMINSFRFGAEIIVAQATSDEIPEADKATTPADKEDDETEATLTPTRQATPTSEVTVTPLVYVVQSGDTLLGIAIKFGIDDELLAAENGIQDPESLQLGQELIIPFTAEELAAYNANGGSIATTTTTQADDEISTTEVVSETVTTETVAPVTEAPTEEPAPESEAVPVGGRIIYPAYNPGINSYDLWLVDLATGEQTPIVGQASQPTFSRDGSLLAYRSWDLSTRGVFFRDFVGGRGGIVTHFVEDGLPTWAPDGYSFAFASRKEGDRVPRIYIGNQLGEEPFSIGFQGEYPSTFPDGRLVVKGCLPTGDCGIFVMGSRGGGETKISDEPSDTAPAVSPDGGKIAFMSSGREARNWEIWVMNGDGSNPQRLTENGNNDGLPTWSPDGQSIAYVSDQGGVWAVWVMNADGSNQRKLFDMKGSPDGVVLHDESNSKGWLEERISWAP